MKDLAELLADYKSFWNDPTNQQLRSRWEDDFDLYRLKPYDAGRGYYSYTSNAPRVLATRVISLISSAKLYIRVPLESVITDERRIANNIERLLYGLVNKNDERMVALGLPSTIEQIAWHAVIRGGVGIRAYMYKSRSGNTIGDIGVLDLYNLAYQMGGEGVKQAIYCRMDSRKSVADYYGVELGGNPSELIEVYDVWTDTENAVFTRNQWLKKPEKHGLDYNPVAVFLSGAQPFVGQSNYNDANVHRGESVFANVRVQSTMMNKLLSDWATIVRRGVKVPLGYWSAGARKTLDHDIYQVEKGATIPLDSLQQEKIAPLFEPSMPADARALVQIVDAEWQKGGLTNLALGQLGFRLSGFAINQLVENVSIVVEPFLTMTEKAIKYALVSLLAQYATGKFPRLTVRGRDSRNKVFGYPKGLTIDPSDVKGDWYPEVSLKPVLPKDDAQRYQLAHLARVDGLLSLDTIHDQLIGVDDPELEQMKMSKEWADNLILNKLYDAYLAYVVAPQPEKAENVRMELERILASRQAEMMAKNPRSPIAGMTPLEGAAMSMGGGGGIPPQEVGLPTNTLPSEMLGGIPGGALNAEEA